jgi:tetratricopeptide (TPR) repeat protein
LTRDEARPDKEEAVSLLRQAANCPGPSYAHRATAQLTLADLLTELGRGEEAFPIYQQVYSRDSANPWAAYRMAMALAERNETDKASQIFSGLLQNPYTRKKSTIALAELSRRAGRQKDAEDLDYAANVVPPDHHWANPYSEELGVFWRGQRALMDQFVSQEKAHQTKAAVSTATALADQYPSVETQGLLLRSLVNAGEFQAALAVAEDILRDPEGQKLVIAHASVGMAKLGLADLAESGGRTAEAHRLLTQAADALGQSVKLKPDYAPGYIYQAKALLRLGRLQEAEAAARAGVKYRPEEWEAYLALADVLAAAGRKPEAIAEAEQAVKLAHPNEPRPKKALEALKK